MTSALERKAEPRLVGPLKVAFDPKQPSIAEPDVVGAKSQAGIESDPD